MKSQVDAKKERIGGAAAVKLARSMSKVMVAKGKKCVTLDMKKDDLSDAELKKMLLGPSGNLRAPSMVKGKSLFVGFHPEEFPAQLS